VSISVLTALSLTLLTVTSLVLAVLLYKMRVREIKRKGGKGDGSKEF